MSTTTKTTDMYGSIWQLPDNELCGECGQPDNCGDCTHTALSDDEVRQLGGLVYSDIVEAVMKRYEERVMAILNKIRALLVAAGYDVGEPYFLDGDNYTWSMPTKVDGAVTDGSVDFSVEIAEAASYGDNGPGQVGVNFGLNIVEYGGRILGGIMPYNFTEECWVEATDADAVETRFKILEDADLSEVAALMEEASDIATD